MAGAGPRATKARAFRPPAGADALCKRAARVRLPACPTDPAAVVASGIQRVQQERHLLFRKPWLRYRHHIQALALDSLTWLDDPNHLQLLLDVSRPSRRSIGLTHTECRKNWPNQSGGHPVLILTRGVELLECATDLPRRKLDVMLRLRASVGDRDCPVGVKLELIPRGHRTSCRHFCVARKPGCSSLRAGLNSGTYLRPRTKGC